MEEICYGAMQGEAERLRLTIRRYEEKKDILNSLFRKNLQDHGPSVQTGRLREMAQHLEGLTSDLEAFALILEQAAQRAGRTEQQLTDLFNGDYVPRPRTEFGTSRITGMETHEALMPFDKDQCSLSGNPAVHQNREKKEQLSPIL